MKEKILFFVCLSKILEQHEVKSIIDGFRKQYPTFRTLDEIEKIDYDRQYVKLVFIEVVSHYDHLYYCKVTNSKGRIYQQVTIYGHQSKSNT